VSILPLAAPMWICYFIFCLQPRSYRLLQCHVTSTCDSCLSTYFCAGWRRARFRI